jgi:hypothetical protein
VRVGVRSERHESIPVEDPRARFDIDDELGVHIAEPGIHRVARSFAPLANLSTASASRSWRR